MNTEAQRTHKREKQRRWRAKNPERSREINRRYQQSELAKQTQRAGLRRRHAQNRQQVFDHYGRVCQHCGSSDDLTIDHVNEDGAEHRLEIGRGSINFYRWLVRNDFPNDFQTLCRRCNTRKSQEAAMKT